MLTSGDVQDIRMGFDSLDISVNGFLGIEDIHTLFLGLGYCNTVDNFVSVESLRTAAGRDALNVDETTQLFRKYKRFHNGEHRRSHWQNVFATVVGETDQPMTALHIQKLCQEHGREDVDLDQAQRILLFLQQAPNHNNLLVNRWNQLQEQEQRATLSEDEFFSFLLAQCLENRIE